MKEKSVSKKTLEVNRKGILGKKISFLSPTIRNFLVVEKKLKTGDIMEIVEAIDILIPNNEF
jgi:hypothetical protein